MVCRVRCVQECNIDVVTSITAERFVREYLVPGRPVLLRGYALTWPMRPLLAKDMLAAT